MTSTSRAATATLTTSNGVASETHALSTPFCEIAFTRGVIVPIALYLCVNVTDVPDGTSCVVQSPVPSPKSIAYETYSPSGCVAETVNVTSSTSALTSPSGSAAETVGAFGALPGNVAPTPPSADTSSGVSVASYAARRVTSAPRSLRNVIVADGTNAALPTCGLICPHGRPST